MLDMSWLSLARYEKTEKGISGLISISKICVLNESAFYFELRIVFQTTILLKIFWFIRGRLMWPIFSEIENLETRSAARSNNRDDLLHLNFTLKISIFSEVYIYNPVENL